MTFQMMEENTAHKILMEYLRQWKIYARFVPHHLTDEQSAQTANLSKSLFNLWMTIVSYLTQF
jgi:hypothetical protein